MRNNKKTLLFIFFIDLILIILLFFLNQLNNQNPETSLKETSSPISTDKNKDESAPLSSTVIPTATPFDNTIHKTITEKSQMPSSAPSASPTTVDVTEDEIMFSPIPSLVPMSAALDGLSNTLNAYLPDGFVYVEDVIPNIILDIRYYTESNFTGRPLKGYEAPRAILTEAATAALLQVQTELSSKNLGLKIFDAYRPESAVADIVKWVKDPEDTKMKQEYYPDMSKEDIIKKGFIAVHSAHSRGSTVDLTLVDMSTEKELDMGCGFDFFGDEARYNYANLSEEQKSNRKLLRDVMVSHGFHIVDRGEWWHFRLKEEPHSGTYFDFPVK